MTVGINLSKMDISLPIGWVLGCRGVGDCFVGVSWSVGLLEE